MMHGRAPVGRLRHTIKCREKHVGAKSCGFPGKLLSGFSECLRAHAAYKFPVLSVPTLSLHSLHKVFFIHSEGRDLEQDKEIIVG